MRRGGGGGGGERSKGGGKYHLVRGSIYNHIIEGGIDVHACICRAV